MVTKKKAVKKPTKKTAKKPAKKVSAKKPKKVVAAKKPSKKAVPKPQPKTVAVAPVVDTTGTVVMRPVDEKEEVVDVKPVTLKPVLDKATGAIIMVPSE